MYIIVILLLAAVSVLTLQLSGGIYNAVGGVTNWGLGWFIDFPSILLLILFTIPILIGSGVLKDINRAFGMMMNRKKEYTLTELKHGEHGIAVLMRAVLTAGVYVLIVSLIVMCANIYASEGMEMGIVCANLSVAVLPMLYTMMIELILLPVQAYLKRKIIAFMGEV